MTALLGQRLVLDELERIKGLVPPMPGRSIVLAQVGTVLGGLLGRALASEAMPRRDIVSAVECTGRLGRQRTMQLGLAGSLVLMALPEVDRSIRATAELHRVPVMGSPTGTVDPVTADFFPAPGRRRTGPLARSAVTGTLGCRARRASAGVPADLSSADAAGRWGWGSATRSRLRRAGRGTGGVR